MTSPRIILCPTCLEWRTPAEDGRCPDCGALLVAEARPEPDPAPDDGWNPETAEIPF